MYEILVGRDAEDKRKFGMNAMFLLGKHYVTMGQSTSLSNEVYMDVARSHVVFVTGKRGSGKSYSLMSMAEGMMALPSDITSRLSVIVFDTMGVFWTIKYENKRDEALLREWGIAYRDINNRVYVPFGHFERMKGEGFPVDSPFAIRPSELSVNDWCLVFNVEVTSPVGALIGRALEHLKERDYGLNDLLDAVQSDDRTDDYTKAAAENLLSTAKSWGLFSGNGTPFESLAVPGQVTVLDVSPYASAATRSSVRSLVIGLVSRKLFSQRMKARREEEYRDVKSFTRLTRDESSDGETPLVWLMVDEAHEFLPREGATPATDALQTLLREGRQPGISLVLASQQPGQIHSDVMTQADIVIAHHLTAKVDTDALGALMQSYMRESLDATLQKLPDIKGAAIIFDDTNERLYPIRVRPRITWHGGSSPSLLPEQKRLLEI